MSNELKKIVKEIQFRTDKTIEDIAKDIGYARAYFTNQINIGKNRKLKELLLTKFSFENEQNVPRSTISDKGENEVDTQLNMALPLGDLKVTLKDYIDLLKQTNAELVTIINSTLSQIHSDQQIQLAYQKAWVEYEAEKVADGNEQVKNELMYKMNTLVHGKLGGKTAKGSPAETGK